MENMDAGIRAVEVPVFVDSIPKAGTHLLSKALDHMPGIAHCGLHLERKTIAKFVDPGVSFPLEGREDIDADRDFKWIERFLGHIDSGTYLTTHFAYHEKIHGVLNRFGFKILVMVRDPRDIVVSWSDYMTSAEHHLLFPYFRNKTPSYRIMCGIVGESGEKTGTRRQPGIGELLSWHLAWKKTAGAHLVRFEDLVGEQGGGTKARQIMSLRSIMDFLGMQYSEDGVEALARCLFGGTPTFNKGSIGRWRHAFSEGHKSAFKRVAGRILIDLGYEPNSEW